MGDESKNSHSMLLSLGYGGTQWVGVHLAFPPGAGAGEESVVSTRNRDVFLFPKRLREILYASMRSLGVGLDIGYVFATI